MKTNRTMVKDFDATPQFWLLEGTRMALTTSETAWGRVSSVGGGVGTFGSAPKYVWSFVSRILGLLLSNPKDI
jgi:hypothetical protein